MNDFREFRDLAAAALLMLLLGCAAPGDVPEEIAADRPDLEAAQAAFDQAQAAEIAAANRGVEAELERVRAAYADRLARAAALEAEAAELIERYADASPAEREDLERRAAELAAEAEALNGTARGAP